MKLIINSYIRPLYLIYNLILLEDYIALYLALKSLIRLSISLKLDLGV